jgi:hypothetical protein
LRLLGGLILELKPQVFAGNSVELFYYMTLRDGLLEPDGSGFHRWAHNGLPVVMADPQPPAIGGVNENCGCCRMIVKRGPLVGAILHAHYAH